MGKRILQRRRGKGGLNFRVSPRGKIAPVRYPQMDPGAAGHDGKLTVKAILDEKGRSAPLAQIQYGEHGAISYIPAVSGLAVGNEVQHGLDAAVSNGNILPLKKIPEGTRISNIELRQGDGGKLVRAGSRWPSYTTRSEAAGTSTRASRPAPRGTPLLGGRWA